MAARPPRSRWRTLGLIGALWFALPLALIEVGFRAYERRFLTEEHTLAAGVATFPLDELGYVEDPVPAARHDAEFRVLSFGDSFAQTIVAEPHTYASVLERELARRVERPVRVVNLGRGGTSFAGYLHQIERWGPRIEHDAVLVNLYAGNDFGDAGTEIALPAPMAGQAPTPTPGEAVTVRTGPGTAVPRRHPLRIADWLQAAYLRATLDDLSGEGAGESAAEYRPGTLQMSEGRYRQVQWNVLRPYLPGTIAERPEALRSLLGLLERLASLERSGTRTLVFVSPPESMVSRALQQRVLEHRGVDLAQLAMDRPASAVSGAAALVGYGGPIVDVGRCLRATDREAQPLYYPRNTHWSVAGNAYVGELLAATLARLWFADAGDGASRPLASGCRPDAARPPEPALAAALEHSHARLQLENRFLAPLASDEPRDREAVTADLRSAGLAEGRPLSAQLDQQQVRDAFLQLGGSIAVSDLERQRADASGDGAGAEPTLVLLLDGQLVGAAALRLPGPKGTRARFALRPSIRCRERGRDADFAVLAIDATRFRWVELSKPIQCGPPRPAR